MDDPITGATITENLNPGLEWSYSEGVGGNYSIILNSSQLDVGVHSFNFSIAQTDFKTQTVAFDIDINQAQTTTTLVNRTATIKRISDLNVTAYIHLEDSDNNLDILGIPDSALAVVNITGTPAVWNTDENPDWYMWEVGSGIYGVNISLGSTGSNRIDSGDYTVQLNISHIPNYNWSILEFSFYVEGNTTAISNFAINDGSLTDYTGTVLTESPADTFHIYQNPAGSVLFAMNFDFIDLNSSNAEINSASVNYWATLDTVTVLDTATYFEYSPGNQYHRGKLVLESSLVPGTYEIEIILGMANYENASYTFNLVINPVETDAILDSITQNHVNHTNPEYTAANETYYVYAQYDLQLDFYYEDTINNQNITGADYVFLEYNGENLTTTSINGDIYRWIITSANLVVGSHELTLYFGEPDYVNASYAFNLTILVLPTIVEDSITLYQLDHNSSELTGDPYVVFRPYDLFVNASYLDTNNTNYLQASYAILNYNGDNYTSNYFDGISRHGWVLSIENLAIGVNTITIYFGLDNYQNTTFSFDIDVRYNPTDIAFVEITQPDHQFGVLLPYNGASLNYSAYTAYAIYLNMTFTDTSNSSFIYGATASINFNSLPYSATIENNMYAWIIPVNDLEVGTFNLTLTLSKIYFFNQTYTFNISVYDLPTSAVDQFSISQPFHNSSLLTVEPYLVYTAYSLTINGSFYDTNNTVYILGATAVLYINGVETSTSTYDNTTAYGWVIDISSLTLGLNTIWLNFSKLHYVNASYSFEIYVDHQTTDAQLVDIIQEEHPGGVTLVQGTAPDNNYTVYMEYGLNLTLSFTDPTNSSTPIESATVTFWLDGVSYPVVYLGTQFFVDINAADLQSQAGSIVPVLIHFNETFHYNQTIAFNVTIIDFPTDAGATFEIAQFERSGAQLSGDPYIAYLPYNIEINCSYWDTVNGITVPAYWAVLEYNNVNYSYTFTDSLVYGFVLDSAVFIESDAQSFILHFGRPNYANATYSFSVSINEVPTYIDLLEVNDADPDRTDGSILNFSGGSYHFYQDVLVNEKFGVQLNYQDINLGYANISVVDEYWVTLNGNPALITFDFIVVGDIHYALITLNQELTSGVYTLEIEISKLDFANATLTFTISIDDRPTQAVFDNLTQDHDPYSSDTLIYELVNNNYIGYSLYDTILRIQYQDTNTSGNDPIPGATTIELYYNGSLFAGASSYVTDAYQWTLNPSDLLVGMYEIQIVIGKALYDTATYNLNLTILLVPTNATFVDVIQPSHNSSSLTGDPYVVYNPYDLEISASYFDTNNSVPVGSAYAVIEYNNYNYTSTGYVNNAYVWVIPDENLTVGVNTVTIYFGLEGYENATDNFDIDVRYNPTDITFVEITQPDHQFGVLLPYNGASLNYSAYTDYAIYLNMTFTDPTNNSFIYGATASINFNSLPYSATIENDMYVWIIPVNDLEVGTFNLTLTLSKIYFINKTYSFNISVYDLPTLAVDQFSISQPFHNSSLLTVEPYLVYTAYSLTINGSYYDTNNAEYIMGATAVLYIDSVEISTSTYDNTTAYGWVIDISGLSLGSHTIWLNFSKLHYVNASYSFEITVDHQTTEFQLVDIIQEEHPGGVTLVQGSAPENNYTVYMEYGLNLTLSFTDPTNSSTPIELATVTFWLDGVSYPVVYSGTQFLIDINAVDLQANEGALVPVLIHFNETFHYNQTLAFNLTIIGSTTVAGATFEIAQFERSGDLLSGDPYIAYLPYNIEINCSYWDTVLDETVSGAWAVLEYNNINYTSNYEDLLVYGFVLDSAVFIPGDGQSFILHFGKLNYDNRTYPFSVSINALLTDTNPDSDFEIYQNDHIFNTPLSGDPYIIYLPYDIEVNCSYWDTVNDVIVPAYWAVLEYNNQNYSYEFTTPSMYGFILENITLISGISQLVTLHFGAPNYENSTHQFYISVGNLPTVEDLTSMTQPTHVVYATDELVQDSTHLNYTAFIAYDLYLEFSFLDPTNSNSPITDASVSFTYDSVLYNLVYLSGVYYWTIAANDLVLGLEIITIDFIRSGMDSKAYDINITIINLPTEIRSLTLSQPGRSDPEFANVSVGYIVYDAYNLVINGSFYDKNNTRYVIGALNQVELDGSIYSSIYFADDLYGWVINAEYLTLGTYDLIISFEKDTFDNASFTYRITIEVLATSIIFNVDAGDNDMRQPSRPDYLNNPVIVEDGVYHVFVHYDLVIDVNYLNEIDTLNLFGADYTQLLYSVFNTSATEVTAGNYRFIIPASQLIIGLNTITLQFEKLTYENATLDINLYVHLLSTNISNSVITQIDDLGETGIPIVNSTNYALFLPFDTTFELYFEDLNNSLAINDATLVSFDLNGTIIPLDSQVNGLYTWIISRDQISVGDYEVLITIGLKNYENQTFTFTFTVFEEYSIIISEIDSPTIVTQGDKFTLVLRLTYNNGHEVLPLSGETVTLSTDHDDISRISNVTNDDGYVHFEFILPTGDYNSLNMTIEYNGQKYGISGGEHGYSIEVHHLCGLYISLWDLLDSLPSP
ncbi:MAG: hypothetical protein ACTSRK_08815 [Promethearchaeota archaeon]